MDQKTNESLEELRKAIDPNMKHIAFLHRRMTSEPGFQRVPTPPSYEEIMAAKMKAKLEAEK